MLKWKANLSFYNIRFIFWSTYNVLLDQPIYWGTFIMDKLDETYFEMLQIKDPIIFLKRQTNLVPGIRQADYKG